jgi:hypothetical protein
MGSPLNGTDWLLSSSSDPRALAVVDGLGKFHRFGPHYSRRTPGSRTFTGVGSEVVLVTVNGRAVWAVVRQKTPMRRGTGGSRGRLGATDASAVYVWRNMMFRNLYAGVASELIRSAVQRTYEEWIRRYGALPPERLRTEVAVAKVKSRQPGRCYLLAGWELGPLRRGKLILYAPLRPEEEP